MLLDIAATLRQCTLFAALPPAALQRLETLCEPCELRGGERLLTAGAAPTHLYVLAAGRLRAVRNGSVLGNIDRYEPIGEMGTLTGEPHGNDVEALRDSLLLRIGRAALLDFVALYPAALLALTQTMLHRLRADPQQNTRRSRRRSQNIGLVAVDGAIDLAAFSRRLQAGFGAAGMPVDRLDPAVVDSALGSGSAAAAFAAEAANYRLTEWLAAREQAGHSLLFEATTADSPWTERCLRQSDRLLVLADCAQAPSATAMSDLLHRLGLRIPVHLVLLRKAGATAGDVIGWREQTGATAHHFVDPDPPAGFAALARQMSGRALSLVLGGGGARGFAHIGLIRALESLRMPVDVVGGTSMGAFFAALAAGGASSQEMRRIAFDSFVAHNHLNDYLLPRVALIRGRRFLGQLRAVFGEQRIEALRLPFFCVSTNLTRGVAMIHDQGDLATWVGTSMAVPGVVPPVVWNGELLADGAIVNSLPTDIMQALDRGPILASDVSTEGMLALPGVTGPDPEALLRKSDQPHRPGLVDILFRSATLTSESGVRARAARADLYLRMPVTGIALFDWKRLDEIVERGYRHAMEALEQSGDLLRPAPEPQA